LSSERWQEIKRLFEDARAMSASEQQAMLAEHCPDPELRQEVERLLAHDDAAGDFLEAPALAAETEKPPPSLGPYRVVGELGRGGMGTVFLARRDDDEYEQDVAIKVTRRGLDNEFSIERFRQERQILAHLDHPAICRLLDGGTTDDGKPYLVMERIEGAPIDRFCHEQSLGLQARLRLFVQVCEAVHYAHRNLVVHRDIKPSNILVTEAGQPKLLDFGTAKLLSHDLGDDSFKTIGEGRLLTPAYASPEQLRGRAITTSSDVYALGVVLYELLAGVHPFPEASRLTPEAVRSVCEDEPTRPSQAIDKTDPETLFSAEAANVRRRLTGDVDSIILMALRKEPSHRYGSAAALAADIERYLNGQPVLARKGNLVYQTGKLLRRHRAATVSALLLTGALALGVSATLWQAQRAIRESERAEAHLQDSLLRQREAVIERGRAEQVSRFLVDLFEISDPNETKGETVTAEEILARGSEQIESLSEQPEVQAELLHTMAEAYQNLQIHDRARDLYEETLALRLATSPEGAPEVTLAQAALANALLTLGDFKSADPLLESALDAERRRTPNGGLELAEILDDLAWSRFTQGEIDEAAAYASETLDIRQNKLQTPNDKVAESLNLLASIRLAQRDAEGAEALARESLEMFRELFGEEHTDVVLASNNLAKALYARGELGPAESLLRKALATDRRLIQHPHIERASILDNLGAILQARSNATESLALHREALAMRRELLGDEHPEVAASYYNLAHLAGKSGDRDGATAAYRRALTIWQAALGPEHPTVLVGQRAIAWHLYGSESFVSAENELTKLLELQKTLGVPDLEQASTLRMLGVTLAELDRADEGEVALRRAIDIRRAASPEGDWKIARAESALGACLTAQARFDEAEEVLTASLSKLREDRGDFDRSTQKTLSRLVDLYAAWDRPKEAVPYRKLIQS